MNVLFRLHAIVLAASLSVAAVASSCGTTRPPVMIVPPTPALHPVAVSVFGPNGSVAGATVTLQGGLTGRAGGDCVTTTSEAGYAICPAVPNALVDSQLTVQADGYLDLSTHVTLTPWKAQTIRIGDSRSASAYDIHLDGLQPRGPPPSVIAGRIRASQGRFRNDAGWLQVRSISEFSFAHLARTGQLDELQRRIARAAAAQRNMVRVFARARNLFNLDQSMPGYWEACDLVVARANAVGIYVEFVLGVDAKDVAMREFIRAFVSRYASTPGVTLQLSNEPWQNGWKSATDPELIDFAEMTAGILGHRDFSIGDPQDGDDEDASAKTTAEQVTLAKHCNIIVLHPSRQGGADFGTDGRFRRWIDHVEGFSDTMDAVHAVNPNAAGHIDEKMGHASQRWVPMPGRAPYERDPDPEAALAGALTAHMVGADTYHYISEQDDGTPGLDVIARLAPLLPIDPSWHYRNDSNGGATRGFSGWGKVRTWTNGQDAIVLASGRGKGSVTWANGFHPIETLFDGEHVTVWRATH
jgi:hypothetical protein